MIPLDLIAVMPVYNEEANIARVVNEWLEAFTRAGISHRLVAVNDGSQDSTLQILERCAADLPERLQIINQHNSGHGGACRQGYERALFDGATWIFQIDSDGQCDPVYFPAFWQGRLTADCVFGLRFIREDGLLRKMISLACRILTALVTGRDLKDANVPYRLVKREPLERALRTVPQDFDLQNIALTLALKRQNKLKWTYIPIRFRARQAGTRLNLTRIIKMGWGMLKQLHRVGKKS